MLERVHFKNIKSLADLSLPLTPMTVLVGPNGCGKSTVLDQVDLLCRMTWPPAENVEPRLGIKRILESAEVYRIETFHAYGQMSWAGFTTDNNSFDINLDRHDYASHWDKAAVTVTRKTGESSAFDLDSAATDDPLSLLNVVLRAYFCWPSIQIRLRREHLTAPSELREPPVILDPTGYGLPTLLAEIALEDHDAYTAIQADLRRVVPNFRRLHLPRVKMKSGVGYALQLELEGAGRIDADQASEGTLFALALLAAVHGRAMPPLVLIDDLDHGLHLGAQIEVIAAMRRLMAARPGLRILWRTTHSPDILNCFEAAEVRVLALDAQGHTRARSLSEHPDYARFKGALHTGEFWASVGERWVTEGRPDGG